MSLFDRLLEFFTYRAVTIRSNWNSEMRGTHQKMCIRMKIGLKLYNRWECHFVGRIYVPIAKPSLSAHWIRIMKETFRAIWL